MTPDDEAHFIALWQQGASQQDIAAHLTPSSGHRLSLAMLPKFSQYQIRI